MVNKEEYLMLQEEIKFYFEAYQNFRALMFTVTALIFTFAFTKDEPLIFLIPIFIILPIFNICNDNLSAICRNGTYIYVFLEDKDSRWESRLIKRDNLYSAKNYGKSAISPYICLLISCLILALSKINYFYICQYDIAKIIISIAAISACTIFIKKRQFDYIACKNKYINDWMKIKASEE